jgi:hypothetical protein
MMSRAGL